MHTHILSSNDIQIAAELIKKGELVAFPTETVYGLGANALDPNAVRKVFVVKNRPVDNPLIIHVCRKKQVFELCKIDKIIFPKVALLIRKYWPGPLTLILPKKEFVPKEVSANLNTIAIRMPRHSVALKLIRLSEVPIAAPSANLSGKPSPTNYKHVYEDFNGKIAAIIKSRSCRIGLESTVLDLTSEKPVILRPGAITFEELKKILPDLELWMIQKSNKITPKSPGMKYRHYAPNAKVILFESDKKTLLIESFKEVLEKNNKRYIIIFPDKVELFHKKLYSIYRDCDKKSIEFIMIAALEERGINLAVMNRIRKSAFCSVSYLHELNNLIKKLNL
ncbi:MAG: L-threonylcarbamoyladenylate synthase [Candidatus Micrarchaeota archaeon]|nr:L-threonylcarbamoyladenylate synthase [Candidatus Micrarchaeota archaeon]